MDRGAWQATVHRVAKSWTQQSTHADYCPPGSSVHGISQARILEWVAISYCRESSDSGIKLKSPAWQADSLPVIHPRSPL